jgi:hypothetical protein
MEARAKEIGAPDLHYMFPDNGGLKTADAAAAVARGLPISRIMPDIHVGAGGAVAQAAYLFAHPPVPGEINKIHIYPYSFRVQAVGNQLRDERSDSRFAARAVRR